MMADELDYGKARVVKAEDYARTIRERDEARAEVERLKRSLLRNQGLAAEIDRLKAELAELAKLREERRWERLAVFRTGPEAYLVDVLDDETTNGRREVYMRCISPLIGATWSAGEEFGFEGHTDYHDMGWSLDELDLTAPPGEKGERHAVPPRGA